MELHCSWIILSILIFTMSGSPGSAVPVTTTESVPEYSFYLAMRIINRIYNTSLLNPTSNYYQNMYTEVNGVLNARYSCPTCFTKSFYRGVTAMKFRNGSVIANSTIVFQTQTINSILVKNLFTYDFPINSEINGLIIDVKFTEVTTPNPVASTTTAFTTTTPLTRTTNTTRAANTTTHHNTTTMTSKQPNSTTSTTSFTIKPNNSTIKPNNSTIKPNNSTTKPNNSTIKPNNSTTKPNNSTIKPNNSTIKPNNSTIKPFFNTTTKPNNSTSKPNNSTIKPNNSTTKPNNSTIKPNNFTTKPNNSTIKPNNSTTKPNNSTIKPFSNTTTTIFPHNTTTTTRSRLTEAIHVATTSAPVSGGGIIYYTGVPGWAIALLVLACIILLLLIILLLITLFRLCCWEEPEPEVLPEQPHTPYARTTFKEPLSTPSYSPQTPLKSPSSPFEDPAKPRVNRTGMYVVNPER